MYPPVGWYGEMIYCIWHWLEELSSGFVARENDISQHPKQEQSNNLRPDWLAVLSRRLSIRQFLQLSGSRLRTRRLLSAATADAATALLLCTRQMCLQIYFLASLALLRINHDANTFCETSTRISWLHIPL